MQMSSEEKYTFLIDEESKGTRIDRVLSLLLAESSRSYIQKLIEKGKVTVDGKPCTSKNFKVSEGQQVELLMPEPEILSVDAEDIPLDIVYEDEDVLVVNKPRGMVVHPAAGNYTGTLVNAILYHFRNRFRFQIVVVVNCSEIGVNAAGIHIAHADVLGFHFF